LALTSLDGNWGPIGEGTVAYDYYTTGNSTLWWDAVSLNFDVSAIGWGNIASAELRFYTQQGEYSNPDWHHYEVWPGPLNNTHEDGGPRLTSVDFGDHGSGGLVGWLSEPIPTSWITADSFDVTLRLWNARLDKVELRAIPVPIPSALLPGSLGMGMAGWISRRRAI
jgi:hypothetical protein